MTDVVFYEAFKEERELIQAYLPGSVNAKFTAKTIQEESSARPSKIISIRTQSRIPAAWTARIEGILTRSQGFDHLLNYRREIHCGYLPSYCSRAVAEQGIFLAAALSRKFKKQMEHFKTFNRDDLTGQEARGKNLLVVGVGQIGREVVDLGRGLKMNVRGVDIKRTVKGLTYVSLPEGIRWADILICAAGLTAKTRGLLNYALFKKARRGIIFVNVGRGEISPAKDLYRLVEEGIVGGLGLDVYEEEGRVAQALRAKTGTSAYPTNLFLRLNGKDNVILTPHNAFNTKEAVERKAKQSVDSVMSFLKKKKFLWPVPKNSI